MNRRNTAMSFVDLIWRQACNSLELGRTVVSGLGASGSLDASLVISSRAMST